MAPRELDDLSLKLGEIVNELRTVTRTQGEDRVSSAQYRTDMRKDMGAIRDAQGEAKTDIKIALTRLDQMTPIVEVLERNRLMTLGAGKVAVIVVRSVWALGAVISGIVGAWLHKKFGG